MMLAPSGGSGESQACSVASTVSAGSSASAPPPQPWPRMTATVGTDIVVRVAMQRAISPAIAPSSAPGDSSAPGVSITVTSGSPSSSARRIPRRASRSAPGPIGWVGSWRLRSWPTTTHGWPSIRVSATITVSSRSPSSVPRSRTVPEPPCRSRWRTPARPGSRVRSIDSQADVSPIAPDRRSRQGAAGRRVHEHRERPVDQLGQVLGRAPPRRSRRARRGSRRSARPRGTSSPVRPAYTLGPRKPISAPGSATVMWPSDPHEA